MTARHKLNQANFNKALVLGLVTGWMFQSFTAFVLATIIFVVAGFYSGDCQTNLEMSHVVQFRNVTLVSFPRDEWASCV